MHTSPLVMSVLVLASFTVLADTHQACYQHQGRTFCMSQNDEAQGQQGQNDDDQSNILDNTIFEDNNGNNTRCLTDDTGNRSCTSQNGNVTRRHTENVGNSSSQLYNSRVIHNVSERLENTHHRSDDEPIRHCYKTTSGKMECH